MIPIFANASITSLVKVGGMVSGFTITEKKIAGVLSQGMLCATDELGIGSDHSGILELPEDTVLGTDLKDIYPIEDIIVEIDNKSLTNNSRIKIYNGSEDYWWLRTPTSSTSRDVRIVRDGGVRYSRSANNDYIGVAPACNII